MSIDDPKIGASVPECENLAMVLLVDDQAMVGEAIRRALIGEAEVRLHYCADPAKALAMARQVGATVILQDLVMPGIDGLELVRQYRADPVTSQIPIIVLSTKEEPAVKGAAFKAGANDYLVKLPDRIELIARIRYHSIAYRNQLQRDEAYRALRQSQELLLERNSELQRLTNVDGLTGLSNKRYFNEYLEAEWKRALRAAAPLSVLMIDVDHFKQYNDTYGHLAGDEVLRTLGQAIKTSFRRSTDLTARFGGEEFVVILPGTGAADTGDQADKLCRVVEELNLPHKASSVTDHVTISVGGATTVPRRDGSVEGLVETADQALYEAKRSGRNRAVARELAVPGLAQPAHC
jgi:two-component system, chemotaxis family, response regulator WspR